MALDTTKLLLLGALGVAGWFVYQKFGAGAKAETVAELVEDVVAIPPEEIPTPAQAAQTYQAAERTWAQKMAPVVMPNGNLLFSHLHDPPPELAKYDVVVKRLNRSWWDLYIENGRHGPRPLGMSGGFNYNKQFPVARVYFFNAETGREVAAWEFRRDAIAKGVWMPDMAQALQSVWVHAFSYACKIQPGYRQWDNTLTVRNASSRNWSFSNENCDQAYPTAM